METKDKLLMRALAGEILPTPPVWMMRQAGRYLPEYMATRGQAGDFLSLCYNPDLACEVTLQPIRRYGFDAAIMFADILLIPQALGADLWFVTGEGPRLSTITSQADLNKLGTVEDIQETLSPIYQTLRNLKETLPGETALIGFAGAPWTVMTYMIAGRGTPDQAPALKLIAENQPVFDALMDKVTKATIIYLKSQIEAGAEVIKLFDSWASTLKGDLFNRYCLAPTVEIFNALRSEYPDVPLIGFPRGASYENIVSYAVATGASSVAIGSEVEQDWAAKVLQPITCVQGNLDQRLLVSGGQPLIDATKQVVDAFKGGPHIFNLGHGITPDADPANVEIMLRAIRG